MTAATEAPVDFPQLMNKLEQQEVESPGGIATPQLYGQLLSIYLLQNDLTNAKFIWKRIPQAIKTANPELALIWAIGQKMWQREFPGIYTALNKDWSEPIKPIMNALTESTQKRAFLLIGQAYSSINADEFAVLMGMQVNEAIEAAVSQGWTFDTQARVIVPHKQEKPPAPVIPSEQQLGRLTDFVSFLEN